MFARSIAAVACVCATAWLAAGCAPAARSPGPRQEGPTADAARASRPVKILFSRAEGYFFSGRYREAIADYTAVIAADPAHAAAFRCRAAAHAALGLEAAALADYDRAVTIDPRYDDAWLGRGLYLFSRGRFAEAIDDFDRAVAIDEKNAEAHRYKALACERVGRLREAQIARDAYIHCGVSPESGGEAQRGAEPREVKALRLPPP